MRILIVPANDWVFGPNQYLNDIAEIMGEKNDVFVWHFNFFRNKRPFHKEVKNVKIIRPWSIHSDSLLVYYCVNFIPHSIQFARIVRKLGIDATIVMNLIPSLWAFSLAPPKTLNVFGFQDYYPESATVYYRNLPKAFHTIIESVALVVNKLALKQADLTLCPCFSLVDLSQKLGCRRNYFLSNGVDTRFFSPSEPNEKLRKKLRLSNHTLVFYGLVENWLDFKTVLYGLKILKNEIPDAKLLVLGSTLTNYTKVLKKMLEDTNLVDDVIVTGYVPNALIPHFLDLGTMGLMPYRIDTFSGQIRLPLKFFVYSAMGKPILSVPLPEVKRLKPKHVFYYHDKTSFAHVASMIFNDQKLQYDLGSYARGFAKNFDYTKLARRCEAIVRGAQRT